MIQIGSYEFPETADLWALFERDAGTGFGFYAGELFHQFYRQAPQLRDQIAAVIRRGLQSENSSQRAMALHAVVYLQSIDFGSDLALLTEKYPAWLATAESPARLPVRDVFVDCLLSQVPGGADAFRAFEFARTLPADRKLQESLDDLLTKYDRKQALEVLLQVLSSRDAARARTFTGGFIAYGGGWYEEALKRIRALPPEERQFFVEVASPVLGAERSSEGFDAWKALAESVDVVVSQSPRPADSDAQTAGGVAPSARALTPLPIRGAVVLTPEVWVDILRVPDGPPMQLIETLRNRTDAWIATSEPLIATVEKMLIQLGWPDEQIHKAMQRIVEISVVKQVPGGLPPVEDLARTIDVNQVFTVGPSSGGVRDGIDFVPVRELIARLGATTH